MERIGHTMPSAIDLDEFEGRREIEENAMDVMLEPATRYIGRIEFGSGAIDAEDVTKEEFSSQLEFVKENCLMFNLDLRQTYGGCMDGRGEVRTDAGTQAQPRPKIIGGPSLFAWYVSTVGNFSIIAGEQDPLKQFEIVNQRLADTGFNLGMHHQCGAARGVEPVLGKYASDFDGVVMLTGRRAKRFSELDGGRYLDEIHYGVEQNLENLSRRGEDFTEENMLEIVRGIGGEEAILHLDADHNHPTHGHEEDGLAFMRVKNGIILKNDFIRSTGRQLFFNNTPYGEHIIEALAMNKDELSKGIILGDQLPIAGVATLGKGQHVGELNGQMFPSKLAA